MKQLNYLKNLHTEICTQMVSMCTNRVQNENFNPYVICLNIYIENNYKILSKFFLNKRLLLKCKYLTLFFHHFLIFLIIVHIMIYSTMLIKSFIF